MGESKQKQLRENTTAPSAKERAAQKAAADKKKSNTRLTIGIIAILIVALFAGVVNSALFDTTLTAAKTGSANWSLSQVRYAKQTAYNQFANNYSGLMEYLIDSSKPLSEQPCSFDQELTWDEYFLEEGLKYLQEMAAYSDLAKAEGYTLSEDEQKTIEDNIALYEQYAKLYGYTADGYLTAMYGEGNSVKTVRAMIEQNALAASYAQSKQDSFSTSYTQSELEQWYQDHADSYNKVTYLTASVTAESDEEGIVSDEALAAAKASAQSVLDLCDGTVEGFSSAVKEVLATDATESSAVIANMGDVSQWAKDAKLGDVTMVETDGKVTLYCYLTLDDNSSPTANIRHILIEAVDTDEDGTISQEEKDAALETITAIQAQWDGTEEGFADLANQYSQDPGSSSNGGLYEGVYKGQMVSEFDAFCFGDRKSGDTDIVYNDNYGYFFIYYVGQGDIYQQVIARDAKTGEDFTAWKDNILANYAVEKTALFKKV